jgi:hypothetical protein
MMKLRNNAMRMTGSGSGYSYYSADEDYNLFSGMPIWNGTPGIHSSTADPHFRSRRDLRLKNNSPAINRGLNLGRARDFSGAAVPRAGVTDIGAYEIAP